MNGDEMSHMINRPSFQTPLRSAYNIEENYNLLKENRSQRHKQQIKYTQDRKKSVEKEITSLEQQIQEKDAQLKIILDELEQSIQKKKTLQLKQKSRLNLER